MKIILLLAAVIFSMNVATVPNTFVGGEKIFASDFNENFDSLEVTGVRIIDSVDLRFIRFSDLTSGDSTLSLAKIDTVRAHKVVGDSLSITHIDGHFTDSIVVSTGISGRLTGNVIGNVTGNMTGSFSTTNGTITTGTGDIITDSVYARTAKTSGSIVVGNHIFLLDGNMVSFSGEGNYGSGIIAVNKAVQLRTNATERLIVDTLGNVGIGTLSPSEKLHVSSGNILADTIKGAVTTGNKNIATGTGDIITDSLYAASSRFGKATVEAGVVTLGKQTVTVTSATGTLTPTKNYISVNSNYNGNITLTLDNGAMSEGAIVFVTFTSYYSSQYETLRVENSGGEYHTSTVECVSQWIKTSYGWKKLLGVAGAF